jgi:Ca2+-binding RTX toxin-like protein
LDGGTGADTMAGGAGNDLYLVDSASDVVIETSSGGTADRVESSVNYTLSAEVEILVLTGTAGLDGTGNLSSNQIYGNSGANSLFGSGGNDTLFGNAGNDTLDGGLGSDSMLGGSGNDVYVVGNTGDKVVEKEGEGVDLVNASISYALTAFVENLTLTGTGGNEGTGNDLANVLTGNAGANRLNGSAGNDTLIGNGGADVLTGGAGADRLTGGAGADVFYLTTRGDGVDTLVDFVSGTDKIKVSGAAFGGLSQVNPVKLVINGPATTAGPVFLYNTSTGELSFDLDGSGTAYEVELIAVLSNKAVITTGDIGVGP